MKPKEPLATGQNDMFRSRLDQIIDLGHAKVILAGKIAKYCCGNSCQTNAGIITQTSRATRPFQRG